MRTNHTANLPGPDSKTWLSIECKVEVEAERDRFNGEWVLNVIDVLVDVSESREPSNFVSLFCEASTPLMRETGKVIVGLAEADDALLAEVLEDQREAA